MLTPNETAVMTALAYNNYSIGDDPQDGQTWSELINDSSKPSGITGKSLSGVVSSLVKKNLIYSSEYDRNEFVIGFTSEGAKIAEAIKGNA